MMVSIGRALKALAVEQEMAVLVTNYTVSAGLDENAAANAATNPNRRYTGQIGVDPSSHLKPALGITWLPVPNTRLFMYHNPAHIPQRMTCALERGFPSAEVLSYCSCEIASQHRILAFA